MYFVQTSSDMEDVHGIFTEYRVLKFSALKWTITKQATSQPTDMLVSQGMFYRLIAMFHVDYHFLQIKTAIARSLRFFSPE